MSYITDIINDFRDNYISADKEQLTDERWLGYLNSAYRYFINKTRMVNEDYFYDYWKATTIPWQEEYTMLRRWHIINDTPQKWMIKIKTIGIKYSESATNYTKARLESMNNLTSDIFWYKDKQPQTDPFFTVSDNSIFIYPVPTERIEGWLIFHGISDPLPLVLDSELSDVKLPIELHELFPLAMKWYYFASRSMINEKNDAKNDLTIEENKVLQHVKMRKITPVQIKAPNLINFC